MCFSHCVGIASAAVSVHSLPFFLDCPSVPRFASRTPMSSTDPCTGEHSIFLAFWGIHYHRACCSDKNKEPDTLPVVAPPQPRSHRAACHTPTAASSTQLAVSRLPTASSSSVCVEQSPAIFTHCCARRPAGCPGTERWREVGRGGCRSG